MAGLPSALIMPCAGCPGRAISRVPALSRST